VRTNLQRKEKEGIALLEILQGLPAADGVTCLWRVREIANGASLESVYRVLATLRRQPAPFYRSREVCESQSSASFASQPVLGQAEDGNPQAEGEVNAVPSDSPPLWRYAMMEAHRCSDAPQSAHPPPNLAALLWLSTLLDPVASPTLNPKPTGGAPLPRGEEEGGAMSKVAMQWYSSLQCPSAGLETVSSTPPSAAEGDALRWLSDLRGGGAVIANGAVADKRRMSVDALRAYAVTSASQWNCGDS